jgi:hypothetical protein
MRIDPTIRTQKDQVSRMRRIPSRLGLVLGLAVVAGCSGGVEEGMPKDAVAAKPPEALTDQMKQFAKANRTKRPGSNAPPLGPLPRH